MLCSRLNQPNNRSLTRPIATLSGIRKLGYDLHRVTNGLQETLSRGAETDGQKNGELENKGPSWRVENAVWKRMDQIAGLENARPEYDGTNFRD